MRRKNHYVPESYLKNFTDERGEVAVYRLLVEHENVPKWRPHTPGGIAYHLDLYTRLTGDVESDDFEQWFERAIETPAQEAISRAVNDERLSPEHWRALIRFTVAQDVRTPARFLERVPEWQTYVPALFRSVLEGAIEKLKEARRSGTPLSSGIRNPSTDLLPTRLHQTPLQGTDTVALRFEGIVGRGTWLFMIRTLLSESSRVMSAALEHRWTIVRPYGNLSWFTTDDPVVRLNFNSLSDYNFRAGWGSSGSDILLPLSPSHLLHTQIGHPRLFRGTIFDEPQTLAVREVIARHAHRLIIARCPDGELEGLRPRIVDGNAVRNEREQWHHWHEDQIVAERELLNDSTGER